MGKQNTEAVE